MNFRGFSWRCLWVASVPLSCFPFIASVPQSEQTLPVRSKDEWATRRVNTRGKRQKVMGNLPERDSAPLDLRVLDEERVGRIRRQNITFVGEVLKGRPDLVSAYLLLPDRSGSAEKVPAVLCLH